MISFQKLRIVIVTLVFLHQSGAGTVAEFVDDLAIKPLPAPQRPSKALESADALLSDWEGQHFAALDADQDKVALSWSVEKDELVCQVGPHAVVVGEAYLR